MKEGNEEGDDVLDGLHVSHIRGFLVELANADNRWMGILEERN